MQNHILQLLQQHVFVVEESGCWISLLQSRSFPIENIWCIIKWKIHQRWPRTKTPETHNHPDVFKLFWKEEEMLHHGKHAPVPAILRPAAGIKFEMSSFCAYNCTISQFKHFLLYLCSIVNKILAHVIWNSFSFILFKFKKTSQHFRNSACILNISI